MIRYNLINPSDPYTFEAPDLITAAVSVCLLGNGKYPADALGADANLSNNIPCFLFGGHDEWFQARFGATFEATTERMLKERPGDLVGCLKSVKLGSAKRSSMNNIGGRAREMAQAIREKYMNPAHPPGG